jgi:hypothetical protein
MRSFGRSHRYFSKPLASARQRYSIAFMQGWRSVMRQISAEARLHLYARSLSRKTGAGIHVAAIYGAFALIAAVLFGSLSVHPF